MSGFSLEKQKRKQSALSQERLRELLTYEPTTGVFRWNVDHGRMKRGDVSGCPSSNKQYIEMRFDGYLWSAHRLAFLWMAGKWPRYVDHKDRDRTNNRWDNLRDCEMYENLGNTKRPRHNKSGVKGVYWDASRRRWHAQIQIDGRSTSLGRFHTKEEAAEAYWEAATKRFGEFARAA